jgi:iron complex outermembrane receptor protein
MCTTLGFHPKAADAATPSADDERAPLQEVTVTARKREERLLDVPIAITAVSSASIESHSMKSLSDVTYAVPNLSIATGGTDAGGTGNSVVFIRGIGQVDYANSIDPGVGTYVDGVYLGRAVGGNLDLPDVQQIEVLRGPQGTLFGKNTMGGAVNLTTKRPTFANDGSIAATFGEDRRRDVELQGDLKLTDVLAGRIVAAHRQKDGYIRRYYGGDPIGEEKTTIVRGKLEFRPDETLDVLLSADYTKAGGSLGKVTRIFDPAKVGDFLGRLWNDVPAMYIADFFDDGILNGSAPPIPGLPKVPFSVIQGERIDPANDHNTLRQTGAVGPRENDYRVSGGSLRIERQFGWSTLRSISAYRSIDSSVGGDEDGQRAVISSANWRDTQHQLSEELNLFSSYFERKVDWLLGAYYFHEKAGSNQFINQDLPWFMVNIQFGTKVRSYAGFGEGTWHFNEKWSASAGVRYTSEDKDFYAAQPCSPMMLLPVCPGGFLVPYTTTSDSWSSVDPRVSIQYRPVDDWMLYLQYATGFKSGGFNARADSAAAVKRPFDMEKLKSVELGAKGSFADGRAIASLAAYRYKYSDLQMVISGVSPVSGTAVSVVGNLGQASIWGAEAELTLKATDRWTFDAAAGYTKAKYDSLDPAVLSLITSFGSPAVSRSNKLPRTPEFTGNIGVQYALPIGKGNSVVSRADYAYVDEQFNEVQNFRESRTPGHANLNARVTYLHSDRWEAALYGKNITNKQYVANAFWPQGGLGSSLFLIPNQPREVGVTLRYNF